MDTAWWQGIEATALATALRTSLWAYPLVNAAHILGLALWIGGVMPLGLRLVGFWPTVPLMLLVRVLAGTSGIGLGLTLVSGGLLFITRASRYVVSGVFLGKMALLGLGLIGLVGLSRALRCPPESGSRWLVRLLGGLILVVWPLVLLLGRLVGYV
ncbi:MAG: hypothetical protein OHK0012_20080 [Synechococcales cyanobacterium]